MNCKEAHPHNLSHQEKWLAAVSYLRKRFGTFPCQRPVYPAVPKVEEPPRFADRIHRPIHRVK